MVDIDTALRRAYNKFASEARASGFPANQLPKKNSMITASLDGDDDEEFDPRA